MTNVLTTANDVIDAIGGTKATAVVCACKNMKPVSNWRRAGRIPSEFFLVLSEELKRRGFKAEPRVFGIQPAPDLPR